MLPPFMFRNPWQSPRKIKAVAYLVTSPFSPTEEFEINPLDPKIGIEWWLPVGGLRLSPKDKAAPLLEERLGEGKLPS